MARASTVAEGREDESVESLGAAVDEALALAKVVEEEKVGVLDTIPPFTMNTPSPRAQQVAFGKSQHTLSSAQNVTRTSFCALFPSTHSFKHSFASQVRSVQLSRQIHARSMVDWHSPSSRHVSDGKIVSFVRQHMLCWPPEQGT